MHISPLTDTCRPPASVAATAATSLLKKRFNGLSTVVCCLVIGRSCPTIWDLEDSQLSQWMSAADRGDDGTPPLNSNHRVTFEKADNLPDEPGEAAACECAQLKSSWQVAALTLFLKRQRSTRYYDTTQGDVS